MWSTLDCSKPPLPDKNRPLQVQIARELQSIYKDCLQGITPIARERMENMKTIRKGLDKWKLPGNEITIIEGQDLSGMIITNGIDSLFVHFWDDVDTPKILLDGIVGMQDGQFEHYTFDVDSAAPIASIATSTLKLLEMHRYPERFSLMRPEFRISDHDSLEIIDHGTKKTIPHFLRNIKWESLRDILNFVNQLIRNIPKKPLPTQDNPYILPIG